MENILNFANKEEFSKFVKEEAKKIINEEVKITSDGEPTKLKMNKQAEAKPSKIGDKIAPRIATGKASVGAPTNIPKEFETTKDPINVKMGEMDNTKGRIDMKVDGSKAKTDAPINIPKEFKSTIDPVNVKMEEKDGGHDEEISTATKIEGTKKEKGSSETNPYKEGQSVPKIESKKDQPKVSVENDPTKLGGIPGKKENNVEMNTEDKESDDKTPKTQVLGTTEIKKDGYSKGQTGKEINVSAKNEKDTYEEKLRDSIKTIQLPESFKNKKELFDFIRTKALKMANTKL